MIISYFSIDLRMLALEALRILLVEDMRVCICSNQLPIDLVTLDPIFGEVDSHSELGAPILEDLMILDYRRHRNFFVKQTYRREQDQ